MNDLEQIRNKLQTVELPDIEHAWEEMSLLLSPSYVEANRLWIRKTLLRLIGLNVFVGFVVSLFAILPIENEMSEVENNTVIHPADTHYVVREMPVNQPTQKAPDKARVLPVSESREQIEPLSSSELSQWQLEALPYPIFKRQIKLPSHLYPSSRSTFVQTKPVHTIQPYGFITYGAFPEVRGNDWENQFGMMTGIRLHFNGYHSLDLNLEYAPVSIRTLDLRIPQVPASGSEIIRSYKRINYICAGIGIDRRINRNATLNLGMQFGRVLKASGSEVLRESGMGSILKTRDFESWRDPMGIRRTDLAVVAGIEFKLKRGKALIRYRQSLRDHSLDEQFGSGTFNSYGLIQFGIGHSLKTGK